MPWRHMAEWRYGSTSFDLGTKWWGVSFTSRTLYGWGKSPSTHWIGGWVGPRADSDVLKLGERMAAPLLRRLVVGFPPRRPGFKTGSVHVGFLDRQKWRWGRFSPRTSVSPANLHSIYFSTMIFIITRGWNNRPGVAAVPIASQSRIKKKLGERMRGRDISYIYRDYTTWNPHNQNNKRR
jgi:hypothetical protein